MSTNAPVNDIEQYDSQDRTLLLGFLFSHKIKLIIELLRRKDISIRRRITEADLRNQVQELLDNGEIDLSDLVQILNELEGWGRQQIYLYEFRGGLTLKNQWSDLAWVENHFRQLNRQDIFNITRPIVTPDDPILISVEYSENPHRIRFIWVQKRTTVERAEDRDPPPERFAVVRDSALERIVYRAYRELTVRGIISFDWDIESDEAMLMIRKLRGIEYSKVRDERRSELEEFLPMSDFHPLPISSVVTRLEHSDEVVRRSLEFQTINNEGKITVSSGNRDDVFTDEVLEQARAEIIDEVTGLSGNIRWKTENSKYITVELYGKLADDQRIGIAAQELEEDIRYVLRRIRTYCT